MKNKKNGFTLSEVLITLVIIGVVAAITIPILHNSTNDKEYLVGMQKARATIGESFKQVSINGEITKDITSAKEFIDEVLAKKYLKIVKICDNATDCGFTAKIKRPDGKEVDIDKDMTESTDAYGITSLPDLNSNSRNYATKDTDNPITNSSYKSPAYFQTLDGYSVKIFYNPFCAADGKDKPSIYDPAYKNMQDQILPQFSLDIACIYGVYDMNGVKGPNTVGKDIGFIGSFYKGYESQLATTLPYNSIPVKASEAEGTSGSNYPQRAIKYCQNRDSDGNWTLPDMNELSLIYLNRYMVTDTNDKWIWSRSFVPGTSDTYRLMTFSSGAHSWYSYFWQDGWLLCVRNTVLK